MIFTTIKDWKNNKKINESVQGGNTTDDNYWNGYESETRDHKTGKTANWMITKDNFLSNPKGWIYYALLDEETEDSMLTETTYDRVTDEAIKYLKNNDKINMGILQAMIFQLSESKA